jgi:hypothetical protein
MAKTTVPHTVTRDDLERRFAALQGDLKGRLDERASSVKTIAGVGAVLLVLIVYLLGRRSGKRKTTLVEIRRL